MSASFEEKSVWIQFVTLALIQGAYFAIAAVMLSQGITHIAPYVPLFIASIVLVIVVIVAGHIVAAIASTPEDPDERDKLIGWKAEARSSWLLGVGAFAAAVLLMFPFEKVWAIHLLLISMTLSELLKLGLQLISYRRGA